MSAKVVVVILLFAVAIGGALSLALFEGGIEYRTVAQLTSPTYEGERVKVKGQVLDIHNDFKPASFTCADIPAEGQQLQPGAPAMQVIYEGDDVPANLKRAAHVTLEGRYDHKRGAFVASNIWTQCPSRYEGKEMTTADGQPPQLAKP
jgi:cytochrome c-type biogenesis protein CcmE